MWTYGTDWLPAWIADVIYLQLSLIHLYPKFELDSLKHKLNIICITSLMKTMGRNFMFLSA